MKIAILLGRGIEGCGATKSAIEFKKYCDKNNIIGDIFAIDDKKWPRRSVHTFEVKSLYKFDKDDEMKRAVDDMSQYDFMVLYSVPPDTVSENAQQNFLIFLSEIRKSIKVFAVQLDHSIHSINRNANFKEICSNVDAIFTHSLDGDIARWMKKNNITTKLIQQGVGYDFDEVREKYWKPLDQVNLKIAKFVGRSAYWKGTLEFIELANYLRPHGYATSMEGMEASMAFVTMFFKNKTRHDGPIDGIDLSTHGRKFDYNESINNPKYGGPTVIYDGYQWDEAEERLSHCGFGADLYNLDARKYGRSIEYCQPDIVCAGAIPIFHKHFGDNCFYRTEDRPLSSYDSGTVWIDPNNYEEAVEYMLQLSNDKKFFDIQRNKSFEFWKSHADNSLVQKTFIDNMLKELKND